VIELLLRATNFSLQLNANLIDAWLSCRNNIRLRFLALRKIFCHRLQNVTVVCGDARLAAKTLWPPSYFDSIHMNFPEPWSKPSKQKHRLFQVQGGVPHLTADGICERPPPYLERSWRFLSYHRFETIDDSSQKDHDGLFKHSLDVLTKMNSKYCLQSTCLDDELNYGANPQTLVIC
jgi:hypothetical protein